MSLRNRLVLFIGLAVLMPSFGWAQNLSGPGWQHASAGAHLDQVMQMEREDMGVGPTRRLHDGPMHGPTPTSIPGGQLITTKALAALVQGRLMPFVVFDVLGQAEMLPDAVPAVWLSQPGTFKDAIQQQADRLLSQHASGRKDIALVFYCQSRECWMSYNAALRAIHAGYTNVLWYRGGIEAWKWAGLPTRYGPPAQQAQAKPPRNDAAPSGFVPVKPLTRPVKGGAVAQRPAGELRIGQGSHFSFALPPGWRVGEDGQFALTLHSPDTRAMTIMVGNAGMPPNYSPAQFAFEKLSAMRPRNLQLGKPRQARPAAGFRHAVEFDVSYSLRGVAHRGIAKVSIAPAYDSATMALTAALSDADQWNDHAAWLPRVADQISAINGAAFGMRGLMQQNLRNSVAYGEAARQYREWSQNNWRQVSDERQASQDRKNFAVRENLGGIHTYSDPFGTSQPVELPTAHKYYWADRQGRLVGTNDPGADPNAGSTGEWRRMERMNR
jgi:PQQ-dependent catabolism-associated CXXCW motif protein